MKYYTVVASNEDVLTTSTGALNVAAQIGCEKRTDQSSETKFKYLTKDFR